MHSVGGFSFGCEFVLVRKVTFGLIVDWCSGEYLASTSCVLVRHQPVSSPLFFGGFRNTKRGIVSPNTLAIGFLGQRL